MLARTILHVDMDAFYAAVEQRDEPALRGRPLIVGGGGNRGVVAAASYEARRYGVRSAMPVREARRRCPDLLQVRPRMALYQTVSRQIFDIFHEYTPLVEGLSLDEAFLDVTSSIGLFGDAGDIARGIKQRVVATTGLTASVGAAPNKLVAKIASDMDKPDGLVIVAPGAIRRTLDPLPVAVIPGIGRVTLGRLAAAGIESIRDLRLAPLEVADRLFGRHAAGMRARACGIDERPIVAERAGKSVSAEQTFDSDLIDPPDMNRALLALCERVTARLRGKSLAAGTVQVKIRRGNFRTHTRQRSLRPPSNCTEPLYAAARGLLADWLNANPGERVRLLGVGGSALVPAAQRDLFESADNRSPAGVDRAVDEVRDRFGTAALSRARTLRRSQIR